MAIARAGYFDAAGAGDLTVNGAISGSVTLSGSPTPLPPAVTGTTASRTPNTPHLARGLARRPACLWPRWGFVHAVLQESPEGHHPYHPYTDAGHTAVSPPGDGSGSPCPDGFTWLQAHAKCIWASTYSATWQDARNSCAANYYGPEPAPYPARLWSPSSDAEVAAVVATGAGWTGFSFSGSQFETLDGQMKTARMSQDISYDVWYPSYCEDCNCMEASPRPCHPLLAACRMQSDGTLRDTLCSTFSKFYCEVPDAQLASRSVDAAEIRNSHGGKLHVMSDVVSEGSVQTAGHIHASGGLLGGFIDDDDYSNVFDVRAYLTNSEGPVGVHDVDGFDLGGSSGQQNTPLLSSAGALLISDTEGLDLSPAGGSNTMLFSTVGVVK
eukprot:gene3458-3925_t